MDNLPKRNQGLTLIELVVVIVILGVLAAFAIPRFANIASQARVASIEALSGSLRSAAVLAHSVQIAQSLGPDDTVTIEGQNVTMTNGYPTANAAGITAALSNVDGYNDDGAGVFQVDGATTPAQCQVTYTAPAAVNNAPTIATLTNGC